MLSSPISSRSSIFSEFSSRSDRSRTSSMSMHSLSRIREWREARKVRQVDKKQRKIMAARKGELTLFEDNNAPRHRDLFFRNPFKQRSKDRKLKEESKFTTRNFVPTSRDRVDPHLGRARVTTSPPPIKTIRPVLISNLNDGSRESPPSRSTSVQPLSQSHAQDGPSSTRRLAPHHSHSSHSSHLQLSAYDSSPPLSPLDADISEPWKRFDERAEAEEKQARRRQQEHEENVERERRKAKDRQDRERRERERELEEKEELQTLQRISKTPPAFGGRRGRAPKPIPIRIPPSPGPSPTSPLPPTPSSTSSHAPYDASHGRFGSISSFEHTPTIHEATAFQVQAQHRRRPSGKSVLSPKPPSLHRTATINSTRSRRHQDGTVPPTLPGAQYPMSPPLRRERFPRLS